jgi:putative zinc finger/helix-turn-helix YgiT family protein
MCSETHDVLIVEETQKTNYKGEEIVYSGVYEYCEHADEMFESEEMINVNRLKLIDVYRAKVGLLNSSQIVALREKYKLSQKDFSEMLEWGLATITRYENHQVQDRVHDDVMRKLDMDPVWFIELLERSKERLKPKVYLRSLEAAKRVHDEMRMHYIKNGLVNYEDGQMNDLSISESDDSIEELVEAIKAMIKTR